MQRTAATLAVLAAALLPFAPLAQSESPQPQATFKAGIDVVRLDVSVLDKARRPIRGLTVADGIMAPRLDRQRVLAEGTGGRAVLATNTPWEHVAPVFQENSSYYLLGIRSTNTAKDGRFRRLTVKVDQPDAEVRTRSGYYAAKTEKPPKKPAAPVTALDKTFGAGLPTGDLPLELTVAPFAIPGRKQVALAVLVGSRRPVAGQVSMEAIDLLTTAFDVDYKERASQRQTVQVRLLPSPTGYSRFEVQSRLTVPPGRYEVRVGAEGPGGTGVVFVASDAPDFSKRGVTLSGLVLGQAATGDKNALSDLLPIAPTVRREFDQAEPVTAFLRVYQGGRDPLGPVRVSARIVDTANRTVFEDASTLNAAGFGSDRAADYRRDLPQGRLLQGQYLLTIEATRGKNTARREVRFSRASRQ